MKFIKLI